MDLHTATEKQIEEMAKVIDKFTEPLSTRDIHKAEFSEKFAEHLYNASYRKQSESEWVMIPVNGVARYRCGNIDCARLIPLDTTPQELSYCPYCGAKIKG